jgi:hypothetical protein
MRISGRLVTASTIHVQLVPQEVRRLRKYRDAQPAGHWDAEPAATVRQLLDAMIGPPDIDDDPVPPAP